MVRTFLISCELLTVKLLGLPAIVTVTSKKSSASGRTARVSGLKDVKSIFMRTFKSEFRTGSGLVVTRLRAIIESDLVTIDSLSIGACEVGLFALGDACSNDGMLDVLLVFSAQMIT